MAIKSGTEMLKYIADTNVELAATAKRLDEMASEWRSSAMRLVPQRMATAARMAGAPDDAIANYQEGIDGWIKTTGADLAAAREATVAVSRSLGALEHCVSALRHKAGQARARR
jgi:hypothetical protein